MDLVKEIVQLVGRSGTTRHVIGFVGLPYTGTAELANRLANALSKVSVESLTYDADNSYVQMAPGIQMKSGNLGRDISEFKNGNPIYLSDSRVPDGVRVLILTASLQFLPADPDVCSGLDFLAFCTFEDGRQRLDRKIKAETASGKTEDDIIGEFTLEQLRERSASHLMRQAQIIWCVDTQTAKRA